MAKTQADLLTLMVKHVGELAGGGPKAQLLADQFKQTVLPKLKFNYNVEMTDEEFEAQWKQMKRELPAFVNWLMQQNLPPPPPDWYKTNN